MPAARSATSSPAGCCRRRARPCSSRCRRCSGSDDCLRRLLLREPRGSVARHVNLVVPATRPDCDAGFIIMEPTEYPPMSGSNTICTTTVLLETGMLEMREPETLVRLEAPGGVVEARAVCRDGRCESVEFANVPCFADQLDASARGRRARHAVGRRRLRRHVVRDRRCQGARLRDRAARGARPLDRRRADPRGGARAARVRAPREPRDRGRQHRADRRAVAGRRQGHAQRRRRRAGAARPLGDRDRASRRASRCCTPVVRCGSATRCRTRRRSARPSTGGSCARRRWRPRRRSSRRSAAAPGSPASRSTSWMTPIRTPRATCSPTPGASAGSTRSPSVRPRLPAGSEAQHLDRRAGADEVAVAVGAVDAPHGRPVLGRAERRRPGTRPPRACTRAASRRRASARCAGRCAAGCRRPATRPRRRGRSRRGCAIIASQKRSISPRSSDSVGSTISVPGDRERHRRRVEAVVDQALGDVVDGDAGLLGHRRAGRGCTRARRGRSGPCTAPGSAALQPLARCSWRSASRPGSPAAAPRAPISRMYAHEIGRMPAEPHGAAETGPRPARGPAAGCSGWFGQERREVRAHRDRADARAAAAVRDAERLVQVQVRDVGAEAGRAARGRRARSCSRRRRTPGRRPRAPASQISATVSSYTPCVDGYVIISAASASRVLGDLRPQVVDVDVAVRRRCRRRRRACRPSRRSRRSCRAREAGIRQTSRCVSPRARW